MHIAFKNPGVILSDFFELTKSALKAGFLLRKNCIEGCLNRKF